MIYRFDNFALDVDRFELSRDGETVPLQARALELLLFLIRNAGQLVSKEQINREVWGGLFTSRQAIPFQLAALRTALGDKQRPYRFIETVHGKGLRFVGELEADRMSDEGSPRTVVFADESERQELSTDLIGAEPTIAVLPFAQDNAVDRLSGLATALPVDILMALSRLRSMRVTARSSSFLLSADQATPLLVKSALGADYSVHGTVTRAGEKYSIFAELVENASQSMIWSGRFEAEPRDVHDVREKIANTIVWQIERELPRHEAKRLKLKQPHSLTAWQAFHVGATMMQRQDIASALTARKYFERAVSIDPEFARAWAGLAQTHAFEIFQAPKNREYERRFLSLAEKAMEADCEDPAANVAMGRALTVIDRGAEAVPWLERALEISPSNSLAHQYLCWEFGEAGKHDLAYDHASAALMLDPQGPERFRIYGELAATKFRTGELQAGLEWGRKAGQTPTNEALLLLVGLLSNHFSGKFDEAKRLAERFKKTVHANSVDQVYGQKLLSDERKEVVKAALSQYDIDWNIGS